MTFEKPTSSTIRLALGATALTLIGSVAQADQVILDDLIVDGSLCVGFDCVNGESFGFDTLRLKENNLRIKFQDTSSSASFPSADWQITINDSSNGGANKFSIDDISQGRTPFTIETSAPSHSLYVDDGGRIGLGTSTPVVEVHVIDGNTPTLRLEQDGSSGFTAQTWDLAGNEANFFIRDVTGGSALPIRIEPGTASNTLYLDSNERIGVNTTSPDATMEVNAVASSIGAGNVVMKLTNPAANGAVTLQMASANTATSMWNMVSSGNTNNFLITRADTGAIEFRLNSAGNLTLAGTLTTGSSTVYPDYVFEPDYNLMPLAEVEQFILSNGHLPKIPTSAEVAETGLNISEMQIALLEKVEELTLYTLQQQKTIDALQQRLDTLAD